MAAAPEYVVKAAFLFNFTKFVQWPKETFRSPDERLSICVIGEDHFGASLDAVGGKTSNNRKMVIRRFADAEAAAGCQIVFISMSEEDNLDAVLSRFSGKPVLTVSDISMFEKRGGIIGFYLKEDRVKLRINIDNARRANITVSSYLLELADIVKVDKF